MKFSDSPKTPPLVTWKSLEAQLFIFNLSKVKWIGGDFVYLVCNLDSSVQADRRILVWPAAGSGQ